MKFSVKTRRRSLTKKNMAVWETKAWLCEKQKHGWLRQTGAATPGSLGAPASHTRQLDPPVDTPNNTPSLWSAAFNGNKRLRLIYIDCFLLLYMYSQLTGAMTTASAAATSGAVGRTYLVSKEGKERQRQQRPEQKTGEEKRFFGRWPLSFPSLLVSGQLERLVEAAPGGDIGGKHPEPPNYGFQ
jgi:hypothetical protein